MHARREPTLALSTDSMGMQIRETVRSWLYRRNSSSSRDTGGMGILRRVFTLAKTRVFTMANVLIVLWVWMLWWGERRVFEDSLEGCAWGEWETWVSLSLPLKLNKYKGEKERS